MAGVLTSRSSHAYVGAHRPHFVYQFWSDTQCLYVGMSRSPAGRISTHSNSSWWRRVKRFSAEVYPDRESARIAEAALIAQLEPAFNWYHSEKSAGSRSRCAPGESAWSRSDVLGDA